MKKSLIFVGLLASTMYFAQVTSSEITGTVRDESNNPIASSVTVIHVPSGTRYVTKSNKDGIFVLPDVRVGGPYKILVTGENAKEGEQENIYTSLGNTSNVNIVLGEKSKTIEAVVINGARRGIINSNATGPSSTFDANSISRTPSISRSINDVTKYNPYSNGNSFGGQDSRFNNFTIDGAVFNNGFGLGSQAQAGGRTGYGSVSLDAIQEIQVNVAPFDVKQSGFAGGAINAVTRSGTNELAGSYYSFFNNNDLIGKKAYGVSPFKQFFSK
ncbi:carboxypeptidase regulatory-like domain-containing protein [Halpernia sp. GG3]